MLAPFSVLLPAYLFHWPAQLTTLLNQCCLLLPAIFPPKGSNVELAPGVQCLAERGKKGACSRVVDINLYCCKVVYTSFVP